MIFSLKKKRNEEISCCQKRIWQRGFLFPPIQEETFLALLTIFPAITKERERKIK
jgi:hypothetical protein